ncbi:MAG TPA: hypothetical protein VHE55_12770 [Fimbriimonadaceae bacterium]|nr:hypothetical protein [Fimbriimonadaceae bacterium]
MKRSVLFSACIAFAVTLLAILLSGCGGKGVDFNTWAGSYTGTATLDNNKSSTLHLTSDSSGIVAGTMVVTGADGTDSDFKFTAGTYNVTGSITSTSGGFTVSGAVPNMGNFFIRGQFPTDGSTTEYRIGTEASTTYPTSLTYTGTLSMN